MEHQSENREETPDGALTTRRAVLAGSLAAAAAWAIPSFSVHSFSEHEAVWPDRAVKMVVPYPAGGSIDVLTRIIADHLKDRLGQSFVVENKPGAGGNIGIAAVTTSPADGYAIGAATVGQFAINQYLYQHMPFDPERDFAPVTLIYDTPNVFVVPAEHVPARTLKEFVSWAQARGGVAYGSPGVGTSPHLSAALFDTRTGINGTHVPFRGASQTIPAMLTGDVVYAIDNLASYVPTIQSGKMRALAVTSAERWPVLPDVPTMAEAGMPDFVITSWAGFVVPTGTPRPIIDRLASTMEAIAADPDVQLRFEVLGARCLASTPEAVTERAVRERPMWREMVRVSGAKGGSG
jgi:tripartite-type tricarboxylate transporter receptor subunit TctC